VTQCCKQVVEPVPLDENMAPHGVRGRLIVSGADRLHNGLVFGQGTGHPVAHLQLHSPVRLQDGMQPRRLLGQEGVVGRS